MSYQDAFDLANKYLIEYSNLNKSFSNRFKYVFVDEMQDTDTHQLKIIEDLFKNTETIIQYYGDPNQAIFDNIVKDKKVWEPKRENGFKLYNISDSKRFGQPIADILNRFKIHQEIVLTGNGKDTSLTPIQINFNDTKKEDVIKKFAEIINRHHKKWKEELNSENKEPVYKAIGWVGSKKEKEEQFVNSRG